MTKEKLKKILSGSPLKIRDVTPKEKKVLYKAMMDHGMSQSSAYLRFFYKGFSQWEMLGVTNLKNEFLLTTKMTDENGVKEDGTMGYAYIISLSPYYNDSNFFELVKKLDLTPDLVQFMKGKGMMSHITVLNRFSTDKWKEWEKKGVIAIINELIDNNELKET